MARDRSLLESAKEFLVEALANHRDQKNNFAILHAVTAAELVLKERLARINPAVIYKNIDSKDLAKEQTVGLPFLPQRLRNLGVTIDPAAAQLIGTFAEWRNQIVHHMPSFDEHKASAQLPRLLDFLAEFLRKELGTPLETFLPKALYKTVKGLLAEWLRVVRDAQGRAQAEGNILRDACPRCGTSDVLCLRDDSRVYCHMCASRLYRYDHCVQCGRQTVSSFSGVAEEHYCDSCLQDAGDAYIQMQIDIERGK